MVKLIETLPLMAILTHAKQFFENPNSLIWPENSPRIKQFDQLDTEKLLRLFEDKATNPFFNQQWIILFYKNSDPNSINFTNNYFNPQVAEVYENSKLLDLKKSNKVKFGAVDCEATYPANDEMGNMCEKYLASSRSLIDASESGSESFDLPQIRIISHRKIGKNKSKNVSLNENFIYLFLNGLQKSLESQQENLEENFSDLDQVDSGLETLYLEDILSADPETVDVIDIAGIPRPRQKSDCADNDDVANKFYFTQLDSRIEQARKLVRTPENRNLIRLKQEIASQMIADLEARFFEEDES